MVGALARAYQRPICYCNAVGRQRSAYFDGKLNRGEFIWRMIAHWRAFRKTRPSSTRMWLPSLNFAKENGGGALFGVVAGSRDYLRKCNFKSAVLGLSGGVDSAVTAVIAVDALGAENVTEFPCKPLLLHAGA